MGKLHLSQGSNNGINSSLNLTARFYTVYVEGENGQQGERAKGLCRVRDANLRRVLPHACNYYSNYVSKRLSGIWVVQCNTSSKRFVKMVYTCMGFLSILCLKSLKIFR